MTSREDICERLNFILDGHNIFSGRQRPFRVRESERDSMLTCETPQIQFNQWRSWNTLVIQGAHEGQSVHFLMGNEAVPLKGIRFQYSSGNIELNVPNFFSQAFMKRERREVMVSVLKNNASAPLWSAMAVVPSSNGSELKLEHFSKQEGLLPKPNGDNLLLVTFIESNGDNSVSVVRQYTSSQIY